MLLKINIGGVWVYIGRANAVVRPSPFFPYLLEVSEIAEPVGSETGTATAVVDLRMLQHLDLNVRRPVEIRDKDNTGSLFTGVLSRLTYTDTIALTIES